MASGLLVLLDDIAMVGVESLEYGYKKWAGK